MPFCLLLLQKDWVGSIIQVLLTEASTNHVESRKRGFIKWGMHGCANKGAIFGRHTFWSIHLSDMQFGGQKFQ